jgi:hypothetical protein
MVDLLKSDAPRKAMAMMLAAVTLLGPTLMPAFAGEKSARDRTAATATPIQHLVVIFQENVSELTRWRPIRRASRSFLPPRGHPR